MHICKYDAHSIDSSCIPILLHAFEFFFIYDTYILHIYSIFLHTYSAYTSREGGAGYRAELLLPVASWKVPFHQPQN